MRRSKKLLISLACYKFRAYLSELIETPSKVTIDAQFRADILEEIKVLKKLHKKYLRKSRK